MVSGIRFRDGRVIDFQDTDWEIEVDVEQSEVIFYNQAEDINFRFQSNGFITAEEGFQFASAIVFDGTDWELDAEGGELTILNEGTGNEFVFDDTGAISIPDSFDITGDFTIDGNAVVGGDILFESLLDFDGTDWEIFVDDSSDELVFNHVGTGEQFRWTNDGSLDVPDVFDFSEEDMEFASVRLNTLIELPEFSTVSEAAENPRSIFLLTEQDGDFEPGLHRWDDVENEYEGVGRSDEEIAEIVRRHIFGLAETIPENANTVVLSSNESFTVPSGEVWYAWLQGSSGDSRADLNGDRVFHWSAGDNGRSNYQAILEGGDTIEDDRDGGTVITGFDVSGIINAPVVHEQFTGGSVTVPSDEVWKVFINGDQGNSRGTINGERALHWSASGDQTGTVELVLTGGDTVADDGRDEPIFISGFVVNK